MREIDLRRTLMGKAKAENCISRTCLRIMAAKLILFAPATLYLVNLSPKDTRRQQQQNAMHQPGRRHERCVRLRCTAAVYIAGMNFLSTQLVPPSLAGCILCTPHPSVTCIITQPPPPAAPTGEKNTKNVYGRKIIKLTAAERD